MALKELVQHLAYRLAFSGEPNQHGPPIDLGAGVMNVAGLDELFEIVGHIRAQIVSARS